MFEHKLYYLIIKLEDIVMDLKGFLYKNDEYTGQYRLSKTKIITWIVFVVFFLFSMSIYSTDAQFTNTNIFILIFAAIVVGLVFAIPIYIIGFIICKILYRDKPTQDNSNPTITDFNPPCPHDYAIRFKNAIETNNSNTAEDLLKGWNKNDANYQYASLIYEGMPPTNLSRQELYELLNRADNMTACDESLKRWYRSTAIQVITLNEK